MTHNANSQSAKTAPAKSYQQPPRQAQKKTEGKRDLSPSTPYREKARVKKNTRSSLQNRVSGAGARACESACVCAKARRSAAGVRREIATLIDYALRRFNGTRGNPGEYCDQNNWASIAWQVGAANFRDAIYQAEAEFGEFGVPRKPAAIFQTILGKRFPIRKAKKGGAR